MYLYNFHLLLLLINIVLGARPGPPEVLGPVTVESPLIRLAHVIKDAQVKIYDAVTGDIIAAGIGAEEITSFPTARLPLNLDHDVTAEQITSEGSSGQSGRGLVQIEKIIKPGPPAIQSRTHLCIRAIQVGNIIPGATLVAQIGPTVLASKVADEISIWLEFDPTLSRRAGDRIEIKQSITYSSGTYSSSINTDSLQTFEMFMNLRVRGPISVKEPLTACVKQLHVTYATPGALLTRDTATLLATSWVPDFQYPLNLYQPLKEGFRLTESLWNRCELPDLDRGFDVSTAEAVKAPKAAVKPCFGSPKVYFNDLFQFGTLFMSRKDASGEDIRHWTIGDTTSDSFDIPQDWNLKDAELSFWQTNPCNTESPKTILELDNSEPNTDLEITQPIYECSSFVTYKSGPTSAETRVWSETEGPISNTFNVDLHADPPNVHTPVLYGALKAGNIFLRQEGCRTDLKSRSVPVLPVPGVLPKPVIPGDVLAPQQFIRVTGVMKGAIVTVYVDSRDFPPTPIEYGHAEAFSSEVFVPLDPMRYGWWMYALQLDDTITARQSFPLCDREQLALSPPSDGKTVKRGFLKAIWSGTSVHKVRVGGLISTLHLQVVDRDSGACVRGTTKYNVVPDKGYMSVHSPASSSCDTLCDCDMDFIIPADDVVSSLTITFVDQFGAFETVSTTITVLDAESVSNNEVIMVQPQPYA